MEYLRKVDAHQEELEAVQTEMAEGEQAVELLIGKMLVKLRTILSEAETPEATPEP